jgi:hypothetical protein
MAAGTVRTTITLPADLLEEVDRIVQAGGVRSRYELFLTALRHELAAGERPEIDAQIALMADDPELIAEGFVMAEEAMAAGWGALLLSEREQCDGGGGPCVADRARPVARDLLRSPARQASASVGAAARYRSSTDSRVNSRSQSAQWYETRTAWPQSR